MGETIKELVSREQQNYNNRIILVEVDGVLREINEDDVSNHNIEFITTDTRIGHHTYERSMVLLVMYALYKTVDLDKLKKVWVECSVSKGLYIRTDGDVEITEELLEKVKALMLKTVEADLSINKTVVSTKEAMDMFGSFSSTDKSKLFKFRRSSYVSIYSLDGFKDYYYGYMAGSTGILKYFDLFKYDEGFVLQLPTQDKPEEVPEFNPQNKVFAELKESKNLASALSLKTIGQMNEHISNGEMTSLILAQEAVQERNIVNIVEKIRGHKNAKFIMIAGPSSSGKTTFANRLSIELMVSGYKPHPISVDNYFLDREESPRNPDGSFNYEDLEAIDVELFNQQMNELLEGKTVKMPTFNFKTGRKEFNSNNVLKLNDDDILVIEGIHCLNDKLSYSLPIESKFKIYISALTQLNIDEHNRVPTTDGRLLRRMLRDYRTRGASAKDTLAMWSSVRRGEEKNIFPFQEDADAVFNSALAYELAVLKPYVEPLLFSVGEDEEEFMEAKRLLKFLNYILPCSSESVPVNSLLKEFIGGGCFRV